MSNLYLKFDGITPILDILIYFKAFFTEPWWFGPTSAIIYFFIFINKQLSFRKQLLLFTNNLNF